SSVRQSADGPSRIATLTSHEPRTLDATRHRPACWIALGGLLSTGLFASAQRGQSTPTASETPLARFEEVSAAVGLDFRHANGASSERHLPEIMGSGGLFLDYDNDGWVDLFLVDGGSISDASASARARHRLYRNRGGGQFEDVTAKSGIAHGPA